jgi:hypothetical protein
VLCCAALARVWLAGYAAALRAGWWRAGRQAVSGFAFGGRGSFKTGGEGAWRQRLCQKRVVGWDPPTWVSDVTTPGPTCPYRRRRTQCVRACVRVVGNQLFLPAAKESSLLLARAHGAATCSVKMFIQNFFRVESLL